MLAVDLDATHASGANGTIAGVIETEVFIANIKRMAGAFDKTLCAGSTIDGVANQLRQASDIMKDGSQDPASICNGISIGLGFNVKRVELGKIADPQSPASDPCN